jgi:yecA family protein
MQNFEQLDEMLIASGAGFRAAVCHGFLCALVCGNGQVQEQKIREYFLLGSDEIVNPEECFTHLKALAGDIETKMYSSDFDLELLLTDEYEALEGRSRSLAEWCQGFMSGLGLSGVKDEQIPSESQELIGDFYKIANLDADNNEDKDDSDQGNDFALMELIEYVRMGAIYIFEDLQGNHENYQPEVLH